MEAIILAYLWSAEVQKQENLNRIDAIRAEALSHGQNIVCDEETGNCVIRKFGEGSFTLQ